MIYAYIIPDITCNDCTTHAFTHTPTHTYRVMWPTLTMALTGVIDAISSSTVSRSSWITSSDPCINR